ncbi:hypothetical protein [Kitasatospora acidiphila]|uniref:hypothetical protein n=1 Tax=Kitasatospora acidiphila TaxID=2567942 RepID=UPI003C74E44E
MGQIFAADVPLGSFQELPLSCLRSSSGLGRLHGGADCGQLRSALAVHRLEVPLMLAVGDLCTHCAWPLPGEHPLVAFAEAASSLTPLRARADAAGDEAEFLAGTVTQPAGRSDSDAELEGQRRRWRRLQAQLLESHTVTAAYPWLASWVEPMRTGLAGAVDCTRRSLASLLDEAALLEAACAAALPAPALEGGPALVGPGPGGPWLVQEAWACWQQECAAGWDGLEAGRSAAAAAVYQAFGSRRRGRAEALDALDRLVDDWNTQARALAAQHAAACRYPVTVDLLPLVRAHGEEGEEDWLTYWEAGAIVVYQVATDWSAGSVDLLVPGPVSDQLLRSGRLTGDAEDRDRRGS